MSDKPRIRFTFDDTEQVGSEPDTSRLPAMPELDADRSIAAEIAVERGIATDDQEAYVEQLQAEEPLLVETGDKIEVEMTPEQAQPGKATGYVVDDQGAPLLIDDDGTVTRCDSTVPEPTEERKDE